MRAFIKRWVVDKSIIVQNLKDAVIPLWLLRMKPSIPAVRNPARKVLILPWDLCAPSRYLGDMAMLTALMQSLLIYDPDVTFTIIGAKAYSIKLTLVGGVQVVLAWVGGHGIQVFDQLIHRHDAFFVIVADILDGKYGASLVCRLTSYCNHAAQLGVPVTYYRSAS